MFNNNQLKSFKLVQYHFYNDFKLLSIVFNKTNRVILFVKKPL